MADEAPITAEAPPLPGRAFIEQEWRDVVFAHWRVDPARVAPLLPPGTRPDELDGSTWVGLIAFVLADTRFPPGPVLHRTGTFHETNVRLYSVDDEGRRGVVFRSLDANALPAVLAANAFLGLPYRWAAAGSRRTDGTSRVGRTGTGSGTRIGIGTEGDTLEYRSRRRTGSRPRSRLAVRIGEPIEHPSEADAFVTARFGMHVGRFGGTRFYRNEHGPWPLQSATVTALDDELVAAAGLPGVTGRPPESVLFASGVATRFSLGVPLRGES